MEQTSLRGRRPRALGILAAAALTTCAFTAFAADHLDGPAAAADPTSDINDLYSFVNAEGKLVISMTVSPFAGANAQFSDAVQYVFHVNKHAAFGGASAGTKNVICQFAANQAISCWIGTDDFVTGDASNAAGITSQSGDVKVFAGRRADPFFFYLKGFNDARTAVINAVTAGISLNPNGCPILTAGTSTALLGLLGTTDQADNDFDAGSSGNVLAIVIEAEPSVFSDATNNLVTVWASTHTAP
jgi:hypothetical protein